jgi:ferric-dicitrate binding protein FerR (iron transport regulator)
MKHEFRHFISRRALFSVVPGMVFGGASAATSPESIGEALDVRGKVTARRVAEVRNLKAGAALMLKDSIETQTKSFAKLELAGRTTVHLGSRARILIDRYLAEAGGVLELGEGAMLLDRADRLPKIDLSIRSQFGLIAVRGTRFFAGPSRGVFGVFVARGAVEVRAGGQRRRLAAGEGLDIKRAGQPPGPVTKWKQARIDEALASVGL